MHQPIKIHFKNFACRNQRQVNHTATQTRYRVYRGAKDRGYSLIECVVSIGLFGLISFLITRLFQTSCSQLNVTKSALEQRIAITKSATIIASTLSALERTHLSFLISTTNGSNPMAPHGGAHPVRGVGATSKPRPDSDIISSIEIDPAYQARIVQTHHDVNSIVVTVCGGNAIPSNDQFKSHLLLGIGEICQVTGSLEPTLSGCFLLHGNAVRGLLSDSTLCPRVSFHEYRPISREISLYIDRSGEFRLISHVGLRLLENQPITRGLRELSIRRIHATSETSFFDITLRGSTTRSFNFLLPSVMTDGALWNEVLL